jgi:hypothetical protein
MFLGQKKTCGPLITTQTENRFNVSDKFQLATVVDVKIGSAD